MSELAHIEDALLSALGTIREEWSALLDTVERGNASGGTSGTDEVTALDRLISLRHEVHLCLNGWARVIMEDRPVTKELPDGRDTLGLVAFLERHARWFSGHDAATDAAGELAEWSREVLAVTQPKVREWVYLGDCPFVIEDWFCAGRVRIPIGGDADEATCSDCGQAAPVGWWEDVLRIDTLPTQPIASESMAQLLYDRLHVRVTGRTVLNWARAKRITVWVAFGPQWHEPRVTSKSVFDARLVLDEVTRMDRECPMCGRVWSGYGSVCIRCQGALYDAKPLRAEPRESFPVVIVPRRLPIVADPHDTDQPNRCHCCDFDTRWCYRRGQTASA